MLTMRWDNLFDDLESQLGHELAADEAGLELEEERSRLAQLSIRDRIRALLNASMTGTNELRLALIDGSVVCVAPEAYGSDWLAGQLIEQHGRRMRCILPLDSITGARLTRTQVAASLEPQPDEP